MLRELPSDEYVFSGHNACPGCGAVLAMRYTLKALGPRTMIVITASCFTSISGNFPDSISSLPILHCAFETAGATASGLRAALNARGQEDVQILTWAGDGGTFDIGLQSLSAAAERNEDIIYVCYDNEAYMNTGIQRSSATPQGAWTTTTQTTRGKAEPKKNIARILAAHGVPYVATASVSHPEDFYRKVERARGIRGFRFIHALSACPTGWRMAPSRSIKVARLAVETRLFPLYEVLGGENYAITHEPKGLPVGDYLREQGRFSNLTDEQIAGIQRDVEVAWERLAAKVPANRHWDPSRALEIDTGEPSLTW